MAKKASKPEWLEPTLVGLGIVSGATSVGAFLFDVVPGGAASAALLAVALLVVGLCVIGLRRKALLGVRFAGPMRNVAWGAIAVALVVAAFIGGRAAVGLFSVPKAEAATGAELEQPYPIWFVSSAPGSSFDMHRTAAETAGELSVKYYVISDSEFWQLLFDGECYFLDQETIESGYPSGEPTDQRLIWELLDPDGGAVIHNEPLEFARYLWTEYVRDRRTVGHLSASMNTLKGRVGFDSRLKNEPISEELDVVWVDYDNQTLLADGWLELDPLSRDIVKANPALTEPIVRAGGMKWHTYGGCGDEGDDEAFEYAFVIPRTVQLVLLDIENTGGAPVETVSVSYRTAGVDKESMLVLRDPAELASATDEADLVTYRVPGGMDPGEHVLLPIGVRIGPLDTSDDYDPSAGSALTFIGPVADADTLAGPEGPSAVRAFDEQSLAFVSVGVDEGSCPQILTWSDGAGRWIEERHVLVGANDETRARTERWLLDRCDGRVTIQETDAETSYIDRMALEVRDERGRRVLLAADVAELAVADGRVLALDQGMQRTVSFPGWRDTMTEPRLIVSGHYEPYD